MKQLKLQRIIAILSIISIVLFYASGLMLLILKINKIVDIPLWATILLLVLSLPGMFMGLFTSIWCIVAVNDKRIISFFVKASIKISFFTINPLVIYLAQLTKKVAKSLYEEKGKDILIINKSMRQIQMEMMMKMAGEEKLDL